MKKNKIKLLLIFIIIILSLFAINKASIAIDISNLGYKYGDTQYFDKLYPDNGVYCIMYGPNFQQGDYFCYSYGGEQLQSDVAYVIGNTNPANYSYYNGIFRTDIRQNYLWEKVSGNSHKSDPEYEGMEYDIDKLYREATIIQGLNEYNAISITNNNGEYIEPNEEGKYGPFIINYPSLNDEEIKGTSIEILINGRSLEETPKSGEEFYLTKEDEIILGGKNKIEITYNATQYTGTMWKFTKIRDAVCSNNTCNGTKGICLKDPNGLNEQNICTKCGFPVSFNDGLPETQDISKIETFPVSKTWQQSIEFYAGKPNIEIDINKVDTSNHKIGDVTFKVSVENGNLEDGQDSITTDNNGEAKITIKPDAQATEIIVTLEETNAPENYIKYKNPIKLIFDWNTTTKQWDLTSIEKPENEKIEGENKGILEDYTNVFSITAVNRPIIRVIVKKTDVNLDNITANGNTLSNIKFDISITGGKINTEHEESKGVTENTLVTDDSGEGIIIIEPDPGATAVNLTLTEEESIYYEKNAPINISFNYDEMKGQWSTNNVALSNTNLYQITMQDESKCEVVVKNKAIIQELKLLKINANLKTEVISDITFRIELKNARTETGSSSLIVTTDGNGEINLGKLEVINPDDDITVILEEITVPTLNVNFRGIYLNGQVEIKFKHKEETVTGADLVDVKYNIENNTVEVTIENEVTLDLSGKVWLDGQTGIKPVQEPNGRIDSNEDGISNIEVTAISSVAGNPTYSTFTDANGYYEFKDLPASIKGAINYYIVFTFDGIHYIVTPYSQQSGDSVVQEINRNEFNSRFETITKGKSNDGTTLEYDYTTDSEKALLIVRDSNGKLLEKFEMKSTTLANRYSENTTDINMGLVKKDVDLAAVTDIYKAKVSINGNEKTYNYNDIKNLKIDENNNPILEALESENVRYNLYLYDSDYNYRIGDYKLPATRNNELAVNTMAASSNLLQQRQNDGDLNIEVTYQILLNNQSATDAEINSIAYYYDPHYILSGATPELVTINGKMYNKIILDINAVFNDTVNQGVAELVFTVGKDEQGNVYTGDFQNWVEIISYSTSEGCIDSDSAPDNIEEHRTEDDTDDAAGLAIQLNKLQREIKGFVFEDSKTTNSSAYNTGNGQYDDGSEQKVDDVIIQLIEIKNVTVGNATLKLEYIWQETTSGSTKVRYVTSDGQSESEYNVSNEAGCYSFKGFIPGNYIVRFIYGDGTYWDSAINTENILKYNGQDYKSTVDANYNILKYNSDLYESSNSSMARDNEARRIEEIAFARSVVSSDADKLKIDSKEKLEETWMCAETSLIEMDVSEDESNNNTSHGDSSQILQREINFGLVKRPVAKLELEKHITSLTIDNVTTATTNMENYDNCDKNTVDLESNNGKTVFATATDKEENFRGSWKIEEELDKLAGNGMYITYTFKVTNSGDLEYIGRELKRQLASGNTYEQIADNLKQASYKVGYTTSGDYLGTTYYDGKVDNSSSSNNILSEVPCQIEDYLSTSNGLKLNETSSDFKKVSTNEEKNVWDYVPSSASEKDVTDKATEKVDIVQSDDIIELYAGNDLEKELKVYNDKLDSNNGSKEFTYRSYAAQLIYPTSGSITSEAGTLAGTLSEGVGLGNLKTVQSYVDNLESVSIETITPQSSEFIAETVIVTMPTGGVDKTENNTMFLIAVAIGTVTLAIGIVLIKKFVIK